MIATLKQESLALRGAGGVALWLKLMIKNYSNISKIQIKFHTET